LTATSFIGSRREHLIAISPIAAVDSDRVQLTMSGKYQMNVTA
jgi:hypothetical protein